jgi:hypothetical protein
MTIRRLTEHPQIAERRNFFGSCKSVAGGRWWQALRGRVAGSVLKHKILVLSKACASEGE